MISKPMLLSTVLVAAVGCGKIPGSAQDAAPTDPCVSSDMELAEFFDCVIERQCKVLVQCVGVFEDVDACIAAQEGNSEISINFRRFEDAIAAERLSYDPEEALACLQALDQIVEAQSCDLESAACADVFIGHVGTSATCFDDEECEVEASSCSTSTCSLQCCAGTCKDPLAIGQPCGGDVGCVPGARCAMVGTQQVCVTGDAGSACAADDGCDSGLYCDTANSMCVADVDAGVACSKDAQCLEPLRCVGDKIAVDGMGYCQLTDEVGKSCDDFCTGPDLLCKQPDMTMLGTCQLRPDTAGAACDPMKGGCQEPLRCDSATNTCLEPVGVDGPCTRIGRECELALFCTTEIDNTDTGTCKQPLPLDSTCAQSSHCQSHICALREGSTTPVCQDYATCQ